MFIKEFNSNRYVFVKYDDFACKKNYYDEIVRIQYNKVYTYPNTVDLLTLLKETPHKIQQKNS
jgi:hypothetical protein